MKWSKDGSVELVDRAKLDVPRPERLETPREDDDWEVDGDVEFKQADVDSMLDIEEGCPNGTCADKIQRTHVLTYKVNFSSKLFWKSYFIAVSLQLFFDDKFLAKHKTIKEARKQLRATIAHTQVHYCHASLGSKIKLKVCNFEKKSILKQNSDEALGAA